MKQINKEVTSYKTVYVAVDGTEFDSKEECVKYENSAQGVLRDKFNKLVVREIDAYSLMFGNEDCTVYYVQFREESDIDALMQYCYLCNPWMLQDAQEKNRLEDLAMARKAFNNDEPLLLGNDYEGHIYFMGPLSEIVANISNYDRE